VRVRSAGSAPAHEVNPAVVEAMAELGIDLSRNVPVKLLTEHVAASDVVITMGCGDVCPSTPASGTRTGISPTRRARASTRCDRSATNAEPGAASSVFPSAVDAWQAVCRV
jgi:arsenate reductase (thioredoxin)